MPAFTYPRTCTHHYFYRSVKWMMMNSMMTLIMRTCPTHAFDDYINTPLNPIFHEFLIFRAIQKYALNQGKSNSFVMIIFYFFISLHKQSISCSLLSVILSLKNQIHHIWIFFNFSHGSRSRSIYFRYFWKRSQIIRGI